MNEVNIKLNKLYKELENLQSVVIAFSGGVDSTFLAAAAKKILGNDVATVTAYSESLTTREREEAAKLAKQLKINHHFLPATEFNNPLFTANTADRCYYCKKERFSGLLEWSKKNGFSWVVEGSNADDLNDYRPGMRAIEELAVIKSPLLSAGFTKAEIRSISKEWNLPTWNRPSAACLVSRLSYGLPITPDKLKQVELAEEFLRPLCDGQVRVRHHGEIARIEVNSENIRLLTTPKMANDISAHFRQLGFKYVTLDLIGYRTGSMNESLKED